MDNLGGGLRNVDWSSQKLATFEKNFYVEDKRVTARSDSEVEEFRRSKEMRVSRFQHVLYRKYHRTYDFIRCKDVMFRAQSLPLRRPDSPTIFFPL
jgi:hypothetical protein